MKFSILLRQATFTKLISIAEELKKVLNEATAPVIKAKIYPEKIIYDKVSWTGINFSDIVFRPSMKLIFFLEN